MSEVGPDAPTERGDGCPFCAIVVGGLAQPIVYEDAWTVGFIDRRQPAQGHTLVVPRRHIRNMYDLDDELPATSGAPSRASPAPSVTRSPAMA
jgi:histidine triad (HIT) family protein